MRRSTPIIWLTALLLLWAPIRADARPAREATAEVVRRPASADELAGYADREAKARELEKFEGGRRGGGGGTVAVTTVIIVLLVVIVVILIV